VNEEIAWAIVDFPQPVGPPMMKRGTSSEGGGGWELLLEKSEVIFH